MIYLAPTATLVGDVRMADGSSAWHGAVLRGDFDYVEVGPDSNIQDNAVLHVDRGLPCRIGARVTVGHAAVVHGCTVEDDCLIGMQATINSGAVIRKGSFVASGAVVPELAEYPKGSLIVGVPAKAVRPLDDASRKRVDLSWQVYRQLAELSLLERPFLKGDPKKQIHFPLSDEVTRLVRKK